MNPNLLFTWDPRREASKRLMRAERVKLSRHNDAAKTIAPHPNVRHNVSTCA
jgi:hypothetical protein